MKINAKTKLFCVIGDPIEHSLSPVMHNAAFDELKLNCAYMAFRVKARELELAMKGLRSLGVKGINVTLPHKVSVMKYLDRVSDEAKTIGSVNTIKINDELVGYNTDGTGALKALKDREADPEGKNVLILGSGGAARAIAVTLALKGKVESITILGRTKKKVLELVNDVHKTSVKVRGNLLEKTKREITNADILIHCTPVGMYPHVNETLITADMLKRDLKVMDIVYTPMKTKLLKEAEKAGAKTICGLDMLINQGAESLKIWLGIDAPLEAMRKAVIKELKLLSPQSK